jgi:DNA-directed RNA polymerase subunit N (RpoN/RPB10)
MELPVRCFSCNKVLGNLWGRLNQLKNENTPAQEIYQQLGLRRECCKFVTMTALASVGEEMYDYSTDEPMQITHITTDTINTRRRQNGVIVAHRAV